jgi:hypothetical protein
MAIDAGHQRSLCHHLYHDGISGADSAKPVCRARAMGQSPLEHPGFASALLPCRFLAKLPVGFYRAQLALVFVVLFTMLSPRLYSQHSYPAFETISIDQEMPTNVRCIIQDRIGHLWFGTWDGLYR